MSFGILKPSFEDFAKRDMTYEYESPIREIYSNIRTELEKEHEKTIMKAVQDVGVIVDKDELVKALQYDREQYEKGYEDCKKTIKKNLLDTFECVNISFPFDNGEVKTIQEIIIEVLE